MRNLHRAARALLLLLSLVVLAGCGASTTGPGPRPTPEGQTPPGEPDASGLPSPPSRGDR